MVGVPSEGRDDKTKAVGQKPLSGSPCRVGTPASSPCLVNTVNMRLSHYALVKVDQKEHRLTAKGISIKPVHLRCGAALKKVAKIIIK